MNTSYKKCFGFAKIIFCFGRIFEIFIWLNFSFSLILGKMKVINVRVIPNAKSNGIVEEAAGKFKVHVRAPPAGGKANNALIGVLAEFFKVRKGCIRIIRGGKSREKTVELS